MALQGGGLRVTGEDHNRWDIGAPTHPDTPVTLMTPGGESWWPPVMWESGAMP